MKKTKALVLFSGGQDSATCLLQALHNYDHVETIGFDYGQRHAVELDVRQEFFEKLVTHYPGIAGTKLGDDIVLKLPALAQIGGSALTDDSTIAQRPDGLPNTFVPGRNLLFVTYAAAYAARRGITNVVIGVSEADYSGYPDCRMDTLLALGATLALAGLGAVVEMPLIYKDKAETWQIAHDLDPSYVQFLAEHTHTCYEGVRDVKHPWGYGCGVCPACELRKKGHAEFSDRIQLSF